METDVSQPPILKLMLAGLAEGAAVFGLMLLWQNFFEFDAELLSLLRRTLIPVLGVFGAYASYSMMQMSMQITQLQMQRAQAESESPTATVPVAPKLQTLRFIYPIVFIVGSAALYLHVVIGWWE